MNIHDPKEVLIYGFHKFRTIHRRDPSANLQHFITRSENPVAKAEPTRARLHLLQRQGQENADQEMR